jgi:hypothetical protein
LEICNLEGLLPGSKSADLGENLLPLLEAVKGNESLLILDIRDNRIGEHGIQPSANSSRPTTR